MPLRPSFRRWALLAASVLIGFLLYAADRSLKQAEFTGYAPANADFVFASNTLPAEWAALELHPEFLRITGESPELLRDTMVAARKATGFRWTPARWRTWFGDRLVYARIEEGSGVCVRPGLLARAALGVRSLAGGREGDLLWAKGWAFAWRDGFLVASKSPAFVRRVMSQGERYERGGRADGLHLFWRGDPQTSLTVHVGESPSAIGWVDVSLTERELPLSLVDTWADGPLLEVAATSAEETIRLVSEYLPEFAGLELVAQAFEELEHELPRGWADGTTEFSLAVPQVDTSEFLAVPEFAIALRGEDVLPPIRMPREAIAYEWAGLSGWFKPWLGEKLSICAMGADDWRVFASQEPVMARYAGRVGMTSAVDVDILASADVGAFSQLAQILIRRAAEQELMPGWNSDDVQKDLVPLLDALGQLGRIVVQGEMTELGLEIRAHLEPAAPPEVGGT